MSPLRGAPQPNRPSRANHLNQRIQDMHLPLAIVERLVPIALELRPHPLRFFQHRIDLVVPAHVRHEMNRAAELIDPVVTVAHQLVVLVFGREDVAMVLEKRNVENACVPSAKEYVGGIGAALMTESQDLLAHFRRLHRRRRVALLEDFFHMLNRELRGGLQVGMLEKVENLALNPIAVEEVHLHDRDLENDIFLRIHAGRFDVEHEELIGDVVCHLSFAEWRLLG